MAGLTWGMASDRYGRKLCLLLSMMNVAIFGLLLGFSTSFTMAVSFRLAIGLGKCLLIFFRSRIFFLSALVHIL
jgi:MFS family permease